jgi:transcriptional regulator with PAS, ATPase and Fis domain
VVVNCVSIPESLFESELFGYAPGAFTGALKGGKPGYFERAEKGTIFMDEIGDLPLPTQAKLLEVIQEKEFERVGGTKKQKADVRIIAATNRDLRQAVADKTFREDLYYRLNVIEFHLPPLRERSQDIVPLAAAFIGKYNKLLGSHVTGITESARRVLREYTWPGNIRELENAIEHAANFVWEGEIDADNLPASLSSCAQSQDPLPDTTFVIAASEPQSLTDTTRRGELRSPVESFHYKEAKADFEREAVIEALKETNGNRSAAAKLMNLSRSSFYERLRKYHII